MSEYCKASVLSKVHSDMLLSIIEVKLDVIVDVCTWRIEETVSASRSAPSSRARPQRDRKRQLFLIPSSQCTMTLHREHNAIGSIQHRPSPSPSKSTSTLKVLPRPTSSRRPSRRGLPATRNRGTAQHHARLHLVLERGQLEGDAVIQLPLTCDFWSRGTLAEVDR